MRKPNSKSDGTSFATNTVDDVWKKGGTISGEDSAIWRKDACGRKIRRGSYGTDGEYGWEIDHIKPVSKGGTDDLSNLQPLYWQTNRSKGDTWPWSCPK